MTEIPTERAPRNRMEQRRRRHILRRRGAFFYRPAVGNRGRCLPATRRPRLYSMPLRGARSVHISVSATIRDVWVSHGARPRHLRVAGEGREPVVGRLRSRRRPHRGSTILIARRGVRAGRVLLPRRVSPARWPACGAAPRNPWGRSMRRCLVGSASLPLVVPHRRCRIRTGQAGR
jgi:hypothetical protein